MSISPERKAALEAAGHRAALLYVERLARDRFPLGQVELREIHRLIFQESWPDIAGQYRTHAVEITGTSYRPPHWRHVRTLMYQVLDALNDRVRMLSADDVSGIVELAAQVHYDVIRIHPFRDGNGRVARLVMNYVFLYLTCRMSSYLTKRESNTWMLWKLLIGEIFPALFTSLLSSMAERWIWRWDFQRMHNLIDGTQSL